MAVSKSLTIVFLIFYIGIVVYLLLYIFVPEFQAAITTSRTFIENLTKGKNYFWAIFISFLISLLGSASIGFPIPFPFVLFLLSNSIYESQGNDGLLLIFGLGIAAGLGAALGEFTSFYVGKGVKKIVNENSPTIRNVQGFGKLVLDHPKSMYFYIFLAAALPIPDDPLWIALGMSKQKINFVKCLLFGWTGKNLTTLFYVFLPILLLIGFSASGIEGNNFSSVITEALMLIATLTIMFFILSFDWNKFLQKRKQKNTNL
jgi:hypothetical protein